MSRSRSVGGVPATSGRRLPKRGDEVLSKDEQERLRTGMCDIGLAPRRVRKTQFGPQPERKKRNRTKAERRKPGSWHHTFLKAYQRFGNLKDAAESAGISYGTVRNALKSNTTRARGFKEELKGPRRGERLLRLIQRCAKGLDERVHLTPDMCAALLIAIGQREMALCVEGGEIE